MNRSTDSEPEYSGAAARHRGWVGSFAVGLVLFAFYTANDRYLGSFDTMGTCLVPLSILRGDGIYLDRFAPALVESDGRFAPFVTKSQGHIVSRYPLAPALLALPFYAAQVAWLDFRQPLWDRKLIAPMVECKWMAKRAMAALMAMAGVVLHRYLIGLGLARAALPAVLAAGLGSSLWSVGSQALWQHGPAALGLVTAIAALRPAPSTRWRLAVAGLATTVLFTTRLIDGLFAVVIFVWVVRAEPRLRGWYWPAPVAGAVALLAYNLWFFESIWGGQAELEQLHPRLHAVAGPWSGDILGGAAGTLFSPNRGLFVFSPWIALALVTAAAPVVVRALAPHRLVCWLLLALVPYFLLFSKYAVWWGGHCFGPRYWTDVIPLFAILLAFEIDQLRSRFPAWMALLWATIALSVAIQCIGVFCYPSTWNLLPANVDTHHERLWDWRDTELSRSVREAWRRAGS